MKPRFRIAGLVVTVAFFGLAFAALRSPSQLWANGLYSALCITLIVAAIRTVFDRDESRVFWAGFLIAAGAYFVVYSVTPLRESICPRLLTEPLLDIVYAAVAPELPPPPPPAVIPYGSMTAMVQALSGDGVTLSFPSPPPPDRWTAWTQPDWASGTGYPVGSLALMTSETFRQIGHSLMIVLIGIIGGHYARYRYRATRRSTAA